MFRLTFPVPEYFVALTSYLTVVKCRLSMDAISLTLAPGVGNIRPRWLSIKISGYCTL